MILRIRATPDGGSRFEVLQLPEQTRILDPRWTPFAFSAPLPVSALKVVTLPATHELPPIWHTAPSPYFSVVLEGGLEVETTDGERRSIGSGLPFTVEDTEGRGHVSRPFPGQTRLLIADLDVIALSASLPAGESTGNGA